MSKKTTEELYEEIFNKMYNDYSTDGYIGFLKFFEQDNICEPASKEQFVNKCKKDLDFAKYWGLKIEERELSLDERLYLVNYDKNRFNSIDEWINWYNNEPNEFYYMGINYTKETALTDLGVPTKLITVTYKDEKIEIYE